jgi:hypothetical protein
MARELMQSDLDEHSIQSQLVNSFTWVPFKSNEYASTIR